MQNLLDEHPLRIDFLEGSGTTLGVSFSGVGNFPNQMPPPEFLGTINQNGQFPALFIADKSRSWMNGSRIASRIVESIHHTAQRIGAERIVAIGNSMGGSSALILASLMKVDFVLAFVPQFSARQDLVPEETRWDGFRRRIKAWPFPMVPDLRGAGTPVVIVHGNEPEEQIHWARFAPPGGEVAHMIVARGRHNLTLQFKHRGHLQPIISAAMRCDRYACLTALRAAGARIRSRFPVPPLMASEEAV